MNRVYKLQTKEIIIRLDMVSKELQLLLEYEEIKKSPLLSRFLQFVVEKKLAGQAEEIKEYTIGVKGLGKPKDFNPQLDASVRIHAGRLRKILQDYYSGPGKNDAIYINIPKGGYIPIFHNRLIDTRLEPILWERSTEKAENNNVPAVHPLPKPILAVLPFTNLSPDNTKDYFVRGILEELSTAFTRFHNISVVSYMANDPADIELKDLQKMKKATKIDYVLAGSVRFTSDLVRLNTKLINTDTGQIVFADTYSKHLTPDNVLEIQEEIAGEITNEVAGDHGVIVMNKSQALSVAGSENANVQDAIYSYYNYTSEFDYRKYASTTLKLEKALTAEPDNSLALALLASMYMFGYCTQKEYEPQLLNKSLELALLAVGSDPNCQHAQKALAWAELLSGRKEKSLELIEQCLRLNPKASSIIALMALAYICVGEYAKGFNWLRETKNLSGALHAGAKFGYCLYYFHSGEYEESLRWLDRLSPVQTPLFLLIRVALNGQIQRQKAQLTSDQVQNIDNIQSLVNRMIFDPALRSKVLEGLALAGLTVE